MHFSEATPVCACDIHMNKPTQSFSRLRSLVLAASLLTAVTASATEMLVDRGLPTANLNVPAGDSRSNVAWNFGTQGTTYYVAGDSFANTSSESYFVDTIRLWVVGAFDANSLKLWGGVDNGASSNISTISTGYTTQSVTYANGQTYQGSSGGFLSLTQVDFTVNIALNPGQTYDFYLDGTGGAGGVPYAEASNAALSGSLQTGADNLFLYGYISNGLFESDSSGSTNSNGNGWNKSSDLNVQVFGDVSVPDSGATVALLGLGVGLLGLAGFRLRKPKS